MKYIKTFEKIITKEDKNEFFSLYPKNTKIYFKDRESTYELSLFDVKPDCLLFKTEGNGIVSIKNPYYMCDNDLYKISLLPCEITEDSKELVEKMFAQND